jgi:subtilisin family serine protease
MVLLFIVFTAIPAFPQTRYIIASDRLPELENAARAKGAVVHQRLKHIKGIVVYLNDPAAADLSRRFGPNALIERDEVYQANRYEATAKPGGGSTTGQKRPWGIDAIQAPAVWPNTKGAGILVGVVDSGIQPNHPDLQINILGGENFVPDRSGVVDATRWADDNGHGTHVAGTIAALDNGIGVVGVAPEARLFAAKVLDNRANGYASAVADGIAACTAKGVHVINMSLGGGKSDLVYLAVLDAYNRGIVLVAAAGNDGSGFSLRYPAQHSETIAVTAVDSSFRFWSYSNWGAAVDYTAPGVNVLSTSNNGGYKTLTGTSMAAPHVSGAVALALSAGFTQLYAADIGLPVVQQGQGLIQAVAP